MEILAIVLKLFITVLIVSLCGTVFNSSDSRFFKKVGKMSLRVLLVSFIIATFMMGLFTLWIVWSKSIRIN
jgi:hypothetical protein